MTSMRSKIRALGKLGEDRQAIAERLGCSYATVQKELKKLQKEESGDPTVVDLDVLQHVIDDTKEEQQRKGSVTASQVSKSLDTIGDGITGLQKLDARFHSTVTNMLDKADEFLTQDLSIGEYSTVSSAVSNAYKAIFQNGGVNVNVNNGTQVSDTKLAMFKGALRG